jgi:type IV secretion system protein TrbL
MLPDFGRLLRGFICAFVLILTGILGVLEYVMAYLEFMLVSAVGIIMFPMSIWEGSKFLAEKLISAIIGFFIKLLFCSVCIFIMLYGFISLAKRYTALPFTGTADEIMTVLFTSLFFFVICKSAPGLAQSLLSGTPSLSAGGAITAVAGAAGAAAGAMGMAKQAGGAVAGGAAKGLFAGAGAISQAAGAAGAVKELGGGAKNRMGAVMSSLGKSAGEAVKSGGGDLVRSLVGGKSSGGGKGGAGAGLNRHSQKQKFLSETNADGQKKGFKEQQAERGKQGTDIGLDYMAKKEAKQNGRG